MSRLTFRWIQTSVSLRPVFQDNILAPDHRKLLPTRSACLHDTHMVLELLVAFPVEVKVFAWFLERVQHLVLVEAFWVVRHPDYRSGETCLLKPRLLLVFYFFHWGWLVSYCFWSFIAFGEFLFVPQTPFVNCIDKNSQNYSETYSWTYVSTGPLFLILGWRRCRVCFVEIRKFKFIVFWAKTRSDVTIEQTRNIIKFFTI